MAHVYAVNTIYYTSTTTSECICAPAGSVIDDLAADDEAALTAKGAVRPATTSEVLDAGLDPLPNVPAPAQKSAAKKVRKEKGETENQETQVSDDDLDV